MLFMVAGLAWRGGRAGGREEAAIIILGGRRGKARSFAEKKN